MWISTDITSQKNITNRRKNLSSML